MLVIFRIKQRQADSFAQQMRPTFLSVAEALISGGIVAHQNSDEAVFRKNLSQGVSITRRKRGRPEALTSFGKRPPFDQSGAPPHALLAHFLISEHRPSVNPFLLVRGILEETGPVTCLAGAH